ncbi:MULTISPECIES: hypothetical protein [Enterobacterales]|uniref:hypothetical protein n=1 Tax=Enterobacterales TaxID=91347 RepID=UPI002EDB2550
MEWKIPQPDPVPDVKPANWSLWWRLCSVACLLIVLFGVGGWFLLKDSRIWLYTFGSVIAWGLVCALLAGWMLFRSGVDGEHAEGIAEYNRLLEHDWRRWAQEGVSVLAINALFPRELPAVSLKPQPVAVDNAFSLGNYPGHTALLTELLVPMLPEIRTFLRTYKLLVLLPETISSRDFHQVRDALGLPLNAFSAVESGKSTLSNVYQHTAEAGYKTGTLVVHADWQEEAFTQGATAWLLEPSQGESVLPVRCTLHRPMTATGGFNDAARQFLHYQPLALQAADLWVNEIAMVNAPSFMIARAACLRDANPDVLTPELSQQYLPHWLGKTGEGELFFAISLMMQMAQYRKGTQVLLHEGQHTRTFCSVSAGAFVNE